MLFLFLSASVILAICSGFSTISRGTRDQHVIRSNKRLWVSSKDELEEFDKKLLGNSAESKCRTLLTSVKWPQGLQDALIRSIGQIDKRYFVMDNSGSMLEEDGHRFAGKYEMASCSRWEELVETMKFQALIADASGVTSEFVFINPVGPTITVGGAGDFLGLNKAIVTKLLETTSPSGLTPLCASINKIVSDIKKNENKLRASGKLAVIVIATDGVPSDGDLLSALKKAVGLPVLMTVRLLTDDSSVVEFWNKIDQDLEIPLDILDDLESEAREVLSFNPWLDYMHPIHQLREAGISSRELDLIDERRLSLKQIRTVCNIIFGEQQTFPDPEKDRAAFLVAVGEANSAAGKNWSPSQKILKNWINVDKIK